MHQSHQATPSFPLYLIGSELDDMVDRHQLSSVEEGTDVILFDSESRPLAHYECEVYPEEKVFKRAAIKCTDLSQAMLHGHEMAGGCDEAC